MRFYAACCRRVHESENTNRSLRQVSSGLLICLLLCLTAIQRNSVWCTTYLHVFAAAVQWGVPSRSHL